MPSTFTRTILHVDMDAFFASVEVRDQPALRGKPVLVGGRSRRGVVTAASYEARAFGCRAAMPMLSALRLCPHAVVVPSRHGVYGEVSGRVMSILRDFTPEVQQVSVDEAFMDCTSVRRLHGEGKRIARAIKERIVSELQLTASVGVATNKFLAKVASDFRKPDGLVVIGLDEGPAFLAPLPVTVIFGVGPGAAGKLARCGVRTVADLLAADEGALRRQLGHAIDGWRRLAMGIDDRPVESGGRARSIGKEQTFPDDVGDATELAAVLLRQTESVARSLREERLRCRTVTLKLRTGDFVTSTRSATLETATDRTERLWEAASGLLASWVRAHPHSAPAAGSRVAGGRSTTPLRLIGVSLHELTEETQPSLFEAARAARSESVDKVTDEIVRRFGRDAIGRARGKGGGDVSPRKRGGG